MSEPSSPVVFPELFGTVLMLILSGVVTVLILLMIFAPIEGSWLSERRKRQRKGGCTDIALLNSEWSAGFVVPLVEVEMSTYEWAQLLYDAGADERALTAQDVPGQKQSAAALKTWILGTPEPLALAVLLNASPTVVGAIAADLNGIRALTSAGLNPEVGVFSTGHRVLVSGWLCPNVALCCSTCTRHCRVGEGWVFKMTALEPLPAMQRLGRALENRVYAKLSAPTSASAVLAKVLSGGAPPRPATTVQLTPTWG